MKRLLVTAALAFILLPVMGSAEEHSVERVTKSFTVAKGGDLDMNVSGGDIHLVPWNKDEVQVMVDGLDQEDKEYLDMTQSGKTVTVNFRPKWGSSHNLVFTVSLPTEFNAVMHTSGGELSVEGTLTGKLKGSTSGGNIRTEAIEGPTDLRTSGGNIDLGRINGDVIVKTSGGNVTIESVTKKIKASTSGGNMEVGDVGGEAELSTSGGDVRVGRVSGSASLRTAGGNIELASASGTTDVKTAGGDIDLKKISGAINAKTAGGNIQAELIPATGANSDLSTAAGDVRIAVPADAKVTIDATIRFRRYGRYDSDNYTISSDFPATSSDDGSKTSEDRRENLKHNVYKLNGGGDTITLRTSDGNIFIRKMVK